ncbi:antA/AntB antirepressor family protein [Bacillus solitudinis]|uniref:antA/AntB antirepressor family protein n=1 Tax=Bacillus solitudinis TaxID=2014074 RepID=UPI000C236521|nr:antA/AntB antirepressor family protein [Bacillus solitudinis]
MNHLITTNHNDDGEIIVSGRELHEFLEVSTEYRKWFGRMTEYGFEENIDFVRVTQKSPTLGGLQNIVDHHLKLDMAKEIAMLQRTDKGKEARQYFLKLEKMWNSPEMVMKRALQYADRKVMDLKVRIEQDSPYTNFGKAVSNSEAAISIGEFCKVVHKENGVKIGRNKMFDWLRGEGYLILSGREKNNPKQKYIEQGWFISVPTIVKRTEGDVQSSTTLITGKGQVKLLELLQKEKTPASTEVSKK